MKTSSIKILNPSNSWDIYTPKFIRVARPNTEEYARKKRNDWFFRCYFEYLHIKDLGGISFWFTLTFNNENLPKLQINKFIDCVPFLTRTPHSSPYVDVPDSEILPCFNSELVSLFVKEMKIFLSRKGYDTKGLKFLICSEYGEKFHRPHLHGCGFSPVAIKVDDLVECLRRAWHYGFVGSGQKGFVIDSVHALRYCTKYVCKDLSFYTCNKFPSGRTLLDYIVKQDAYDSSDLRKKLRTSMPQTISSKGIGACYMKYLLSLPDSELIRLCTGKKKINLPLGDGLDFQLPQYYVNKLSYYVHKDLTKEYGRTICLLTDLGRLCLRFKLQDRIQNVETRIREIDFNVCSGLCLLSDYYKVHRCDVGTLAWYIGFLRYLVPSRSGRIDTSVTPDYIFSNKEHLFTEFMSEKMNVYVTDFLLASGQIEESDLSELRCGGSLVSRPLYFDRNVNPALRSCTISDLKAFSQYEESARAFDSLMDKLFDVRECKKYNKRIQLESDKHKCIKSNPQLIKSYESI